MTTPVTPGPWHLVEDSTGGIWLHGPDGLSLGSIQHLADAEFILEAVREHFDCLYPEEVCHDEA